MALFFQPVRYASKRGRGTFDLDSTSQRQFPLLPLRGLDTLCGRLPIWQSIHRVFITVGIFSSENFEKYRRRQNNVCYIICRHFCHRICISFAYGYLHDVVRRRAMCEWAFILTHLRTTPDCFETSELPRSRPTYMRLMCSV